MPKRRLVRRGAALPLGGIGGGLEHNRQAFLELYDRFVDRIYRYTHCSVGDATTAEELTAQVFLKAWQAMGRYPIGERAFGNRLYRIAHETVVDYFLTQRSGAQREGRVQASTDAEDAAARSHMTEILQRAIVGLTREQHQVIILRFLEGYSTVEVAHVMGQHQNAVRSLQHRALVALSQMLRVSAPG